MSGEPQPRGFCCMPMGSTPAGVLLGDSADYERRNASRATGKPSRTAMGRHIVPAFSRSTAVPSTLTPSPLPSSPLPSSPLPHFPPSLPASIEPLRPTLLPARPFLPSSDPLSSLLSAQLPASNLTWQTEHSATSPLPPLLSPVSWLRLVRPGSPASAAVITGAYIAAAGAAALVAPKTVFGEASFKASAVT